jgi:O-antigen ligase
VASIALIRAPRQIWRLLLLVVAVPLLLAVAFQISGASWDEMLPVHAGVDESALERLEQMAQFRDSFIRSDSLVAATVGTRRFHSETFYLALIIRAGVPALVLYMAVIASTLIRGWNLRARSRIHAAALCFVLLVCVSSLFIPNLDSYPTNFYFWLGVGVIWMEPSELALKNETRAAASRLRAVPASF